MTSKKTRRPQGKRREKNKSILINALGYEIEGLDHAICHGDWRPSQMAKSKIGRKRTPKSVPKLPDFEQSKSAVLDSLTSPSSQQTYGMANQQEDRGSP
jgi:hypothetical protein